MLTWKSASSGMRCVKYLGDRMALIELCGPVLDADGVAKDAVFWVSERLSGETPDTELKYLFYKNCVFYKYECTGEMLATRL